MNAQTVPKAPLFQPAPAMHGSDEIQGRLNYT
jgi:hypothetical protein